MNRRNFATRAICGIAAMVGLRPPKAKRPERVWTWKDYRYPWNTAMGAESSDGHDIWISQCWAPATHDGLHYHVRWYLSVTPKIPIDSPLTLESNFTIPYIRHCLVEHDTAKAKAERIANAILDMLERAE